MATYFLDLDPNNQNNLRNPLNFSKLIDIPNSPGLPEIGYYNSDLPLPDNIKDIDTTKLTETNNYNILKQNVGATCSVTFNNPLYSDTKDNNISKYLPSTNINAMDIPYYLGKQGVLSDPNYSNNLTKQANISTKDQLVSQIQYLVCQLISSRNRYYDLNKFMSYGYTSSLKSIFEKLGKKMKPFVVVVFIVTMYFLIGGFLSSFDIVANVMNLIQKNSDYSYTYWIGILLGLLIPISILIGIYTYQINKNLNQLEKDEITNNPYGIQNNLSNKNMNLDYLTLVLYILLIYSFVAVLFTIKKKSFNNLIYTILIGGIFIVITVLIYVLYAYIPFFNTADPTNIMSIEPKSLRLFIESPGDPQLEDISNIFTNIQEDIILRDIFILTVIIVFILAILYFSSKNTFSILKGLLGSCAILIIPMLWVINFIIGIKFFYIYPILLLLIRFIRYLIMFTLYMINKNNISSSFSDDLINKLENFKNYSPSWGLIGIDELKLLLNIYGYENIFSKSFIGDNNSANLSDNKFIASGFLNIFVNNKQIFLTIFSGFVTLIVSIIILYGYIKIQN
jgi:hypothetical protein